MKLYAGDPSPGRPFYVSEKADTCAVVRNSLCYNQLAVFRVAVSSTLKTVNYLINNRLRSTHSVLSRYLSSQKLDKCRLQAARTVECLSFQQSLTCSGDFFDDFLAAGLRYFDVCAGIDQVCLGREAVAHY